MESKVIGPNFETEKEELHIDIGSIWSIIQAHKIHARSTNAKDSAGAYAAVKTTHKREAAVMMGTESNMAQSGFRNPRHTGQSRQRGRNWDVQPITMAGTMHARNALGNTSTRALQWSNAQSRLQGPSRTPRKPFLDNRGTRCCGSRFDAVQNSVYEDSSGLRGEVRGMHPTPPVEHKSGKWMQNDRRYSGMRASADFVNNMQDRCRNGSHRFSGEPIRMPDRHYVHDSRPNHPSMLGYRTGFAHHSVSRSGDTQRNSSMSQANRPTPRGSYAPDRDYRSVRERY